MEQPINIIIRKACEKCGNPEVMFWCGECEKNGEDEFCECGERTIVDKNYHLDCNK